jgi:hypothetical protein
MVEACDAAPADQCCGALPCTLCLELEIYGEATTYGTATFGGSSWNGTVGGLAFVSYWERSYLSGECEYVVTLDGEEVYRATCYEGASCRDPGGSVGVTIGYDEGTLTWTKHEPRPLALTIDPDTGCNDFFCGTCRCTCRALCVEVAEVIAYGFVDTYSGELSDSSYSDCDPPVWSGTIGNFEISLALDRDDYGNCIVRATANGEETTALVTGCDDISGTVELYDGSSFTFRCKDCNQCAQVIDNCICGRPMGETLRVVWTSGNGTHGSASRTFDLTYGMQDEPTITCAPWSPGPFPGYRGSVSGTFPLPMGGTKENALEVILVCKCIGCVYCIYYRWLGGGRPDFWVQSAYVVLSCDCPAILDQVEGMELYDGWGHQVNDILIYELESNC